MNLQSRLIAAAAVAAILMAAPAAFAQTPVSAPIAAQAGPDLLGPGALAGLFQAPSVEAAGIVAGKDSRRASLVSQAAAAGIREARKTTAKTPRQSWAARHSGWMYVIGIVGGFFAVMIIWAVASE